jgi:hypothetical protein
MALKTQSNPPAMAIRDGGSAMVTAHYAVAVPLSWVAAALALAASVLGFFIDGVYTGDAATAETFRAYDVVAALVVVPCLAVALRSVPRGSALARLLVPSMLGYLVYTYAYYLFGTGFNDLFLLHAAVFATSLMALVATVAGLDVRAVAGRFDPRTKVRVVAGLLGMLGIALAGLWVWNALRTAVSGDLPAGSALVESDAVVHLGMALDLGLLVPLYLSAAVLMWRRMQWGYVLAALALFAGILHQVSYMVAMPFQVAADVRDAVSFDPGEPAIVLVYVVAAAVLLRGLRTAHRPHVQGAGPDRRRGSGIERGSSLD